MKCWIFLKLASLVSSHVWDCSVLGFGMIQEEWLRRQQSELREQRDNLSLKILVLETEPLRSKYSLGTAQCFFFRACSLLSEVSNTCKSKKPKSRRASGL